MEQVRCPNCGMYRVSTRKARIEPDTHKEVHLSDPGETYAIPLAGIAALFFGVAGILIDINSKNSDENYNVLLSHFGVGSLAVFLLGKW